MCDARDGTDSLPSGRVRAAMWFFPSNRRPTRPDRARAGTRRAGTWVLVAASLVASCSQPGTGMARVAERGDVPRALQMYRAHVRERRAADPDALAEIALAVLRRAAASPDARERAAGFSAVRSLGLRAREIYEELARQQGIVGDRAAAALYDLDGRRGSPPLRLVVAARSTEPERRVAGLAALEGNGEVAALVSALDDVSPEVRRQAAMRLSRAGARPEATRALAEHALRDPDASVRAAAVNALGGHGEAAAGALEQALGDRESFIRMMVPSALAQAAPARAEALLAPLLAREPTPLSLEAARVLAGRRNPLAEGYVLGALESRDPSVRAQAAVAAISLADGHLAALAPHIEDADVEVQVRVAGILASRDEYRARVIRALRPVAQRPEPMVAIRALGVLAEAGDAEAAMPLRGALASPDANVRRLAVLSWSHLVAAGVGDVDALAPLLEDADRSVRLMAAVEIVRLATR